MKQLLTGKQMKQADTWSIKEFGMESLILMERAALCAAQHIMSVQKPGRVFIMCGMGNNGADGLAMARILSQNGCYWTNREGNEGMALSKSAFRQNGYFACAILL